jgi:hypothetical protein
MHNATILAAENRQLYAANTRVQKKRAKKTMFVSRGEVLTGQKVLEGRNQPITYDKVRIQVVEPSSRKAFIHALPTYGLYKSLEHTACICPERQ